MATNSDNTYLDIQDRQTTSSTQWEYQWSPHDLNNIDKNISYFEEMLQVAKSIKYQGPYFDLPEPPKVTLKNIISKPKKSKKAKNQNSVLEDLEKSVVCLPIMELISVECDNQETHGILLHCNTLFLHITSVQKYVLLRYYFLGKYLQKLRSKFGNSQDFKKYLDKHAVDGLKDVDNINFIINFYDFTDHYPRFLRCGVTITHFKNVFSALKIEMGDLSDQDKMKWKSTDYIHV